MESSSLWFDAAKNEKLVLETVALPMLGLADSLNVSATAAVLAYESCTTAKRMNIKQPCESTCILCLKMI